MKLYENKFYTVSIAPMGDTYHVTNKFTHVVEHKEIKFPTAIHTAKGLDAALIKLMEADSAN